MFPPFLLFRGACRATRRLRIAVPLLLQRRGLDAAWRRWPCAFFRESRFCCYKTTVRIWCRDVGGVVDTGKIYSPVVVFRLRLWRLEFWYLEPFRLPIGGNPGRSPFRLFLIISEVFSFCSALRVLIFAVCFSRIRLTVSCFWNLLKALVGHFSCWALLIWLSPSDWLLFIQDSLLFCWKWCCL